MFVPLTYLVQLLRAAADYWEPKVYPNELMQWKNVEVRCLLTCVPDKSCVDENVYARPVDE